MKIIALLDCNNFFASCERLANPALKNRPVVVLSNNDGCIIARSNEAKSLGISMGVPLFKVKDILEKNKVVICSSNFYLYNDISNKVMSALAKIVKDLEIYSIDEAFFSLGDSNKLSPRYVCEYASYIQTHIEKTVGIPVSIGIAVTKTLAKLANKIAKEKKLGVFSLYLENPEYEQSKSKIDLYLKDTEVCDIWGIGWGSQRLFKKHGIYTAFDLKYTNDLWIKQHMNINGMRTVLELRGTPCFLLDTQRINEPNQSITSSRSFGIKVKTSEEIKEAVANFISSAAYKLRSQKLIASVLHVSLSVCEGTNFRGSSFFASSILDPPSAETSDFIRVASKLIDEIFVSGLLYRKAGVMFTGLKAANTLQLSLFKTQEPKPKNISIIVDKINDEFGSGSIFWAAMGNPYHQRSWPSKRQWVAHSNLH